MGPESKEEKEELEFPRREERVVAVDEDAEERERLWWWCWRNVEGEGSNGEGEGAKGSMKRFTRSRRVEVRENLRFERAVMTEGERCEFEGGRVSRRPRVGGAGTETHGTLGVGLHGLRGFHNAASRRAGVKGRRGRK